MTGNNPLSEDRRVPKCSHCGWPMRKTVYGWLCECFLGRRRASVKASGEQS